MMCAGASFPPPPGVKLPVGAYLMNFDPDYDHGTGWVEWTWKPEEAMVFESLEAAVATWMTVPLARPRGAGGEPHRPLTAFVIAYAPARLHARRAA